MDLSEELLKVLERARSEGGYFNPWIISGVLTGIQEGDPQADKKISNELDTWARNMFEC